MSHTLRSSRMRATDQQAQGQVERSPPFLLVLPCTVACAFFFHSFFGIRVPSPPLTCSAMPMASAAPPPPTTTHMTPPPVHSPAPPRPWPPPPPRPAPRRQEWRAPHPPLTGSRTAASTSQGPEGCSRGGHMVNSSTLDVHQMYISSWTWPAAGPGLNGHIHS